MGDRKMVVEVPARNDQAYRISDAVGFFPTEDTVMVPCVVVEMYMADIKALHREEVLILSESLPVGKTTALVELEMSGFPWRRRYRASRVDIGRGLEPYYRPVW